MKSLFSLLMLLLFSLIASCRWDNDDEGSHVVPIEGIVIEKATNGQDADTAPGPLILVGDPVSWAYEVTNTGNTSLTGVSVTDDQDIEVSCPRVALSASDSMICYASGTATHGQYTNVGTARGTLPEGDTLSDTDISHYLGFEYGEFIEEWVTRYDSGGSDSVKAMGISPDGSIYVTGSSDDGIYPSDIVTVKYDKNGNTLWTRVFNNNQLDVPHAIAFDDSGNIYIKGQSNDDESGLNGILIKYNPQGSVTWARRHELSSSTLPGSLAVDGEGNSYITGYTGDSGGGQDYKTIRFDSYGNTVWERYYDGGNDDRGCCLFLDAEGNVYVTGNSANPLYPRIRIDAVTIKYDKDGNEIWIRHYNSPGEDGINLLYSNENYPRDVATDFQGNILVFGIFSYQDLYDDPSGSYPTVVKYDINGNELFRKDLSGGGSALMTLDSEGYLYCSDDTYNYYTWWLGSDYRTVKYDMDGNKLWVARYDYNEKWDEPRSLAVDADGNVYVTGVSDGDFATVKYDRNGNELASIRYDNGGSDDPVALIVDDSGSLFVSGVSEDPAATENDFATIKYKIIEPDQGLADD